MKKQGRSSTISTCKSLRPTPFLKIIVLIVLIKCSHLTCSITNWMVFPAMKLYSMKQCAHQAKGYAIRKRIPTTLSAIKCKTQPLVAVGMTTLTSPHWWMSRSSQPSQTFCFMMTVATIPTKREEHHSWLSMTSLTIRHTRHRIKTKICSLSWRRIARSLQWPWP